MITSVVFRCEVEFQHIDLAQLSDSDWLDFRGNKRVTNMGNYYQIFRQVFGAKRKKDVSQPSRFAHVI